MFKNIENTTYKVNENGDVYNRKTGNKLKPSLKDNGYLYFNLNVDGKQKIHYQHRLIGTYFIDNPENKPQINHKNGIKTDNRIENLEWVTESENSKHAYDNGLIGTPDAKGESHGMSKLSKDQVEQIKYIYKHTSISQLKLGKSFGVSESQVGRIVRNQQWVSC